MVTRVVRDCFLARRITRKLTSWFAQWFTRSSKLSMVHSKTAIGIALELDPCIGCDYPLSWKFICLL